MACSVPVLLLAFNRPDATRRVMEQIRKAAPPRVYVHGDGARPQVAGEAEKVAAVRREIVEGIGPETPLITLFRAENWGLRKGVSDALSWFFDREEMGIVLEDDCVPDPSMFRFCEELLIRYKDDPRVMHIGCSNLAGHCTGNFPESYVFSHFSLVWGWASWRRAWQKMSPDLEGLEEFQRQGLLKQYIPGRMAQAYMLDKFWATKNRQNNSWAYAWFYSILNNNGLCIFPRTNLVQNVGVGEEGATHTTRADARAQIRATPMPFPMVHPASTGINPEIERQIFYVSQKRKHRLVLWYLLHRLGLR